MVEESARIDSLLLEELADTVRSAADLPPPIVCCADPTLLSSTWQKAIRRNQVQWAVGCALALHQRDPGYVWRRLRVIALEDISIAHLPLVAQVVAVAGKRQRQRHLGEQRLLMHLVTRLARAPKSRTACEMLTWAALSTVPVPADVAGLQTLLRHPAALPRSAAVVRALAGVSQRVRGRWQTVVRADAALRDRWLEALAPSPLLAYIARRGGNSYGLNLLAVLSAQLSAHGTHVRATVPTSPESNRRIGGVPAYGYCQYSDAGREALRWFLRTPSPLADALRAAAGVSAQAALGHLVFHEEGDHCQRELMFVGAEAIRTQSELATLRGAGLAAAAIAGLAAQVRGALPALNAARRAVARRRGGSP